MSNHVYTVKLADIAPGKPFMMVNYTGIYIRIESDPKYKITRVAAMGEISYPFNDDGHHVPVVELATGTMFFMAKQKPCLVYPGESYSSKG